MPDSSPKSNEKKVKIFFHCLNCWQKKALPKMIPFSSPFFRYYFSRKLRAFRKWYRFSRHFGGIYILIFPAYNATRWHYIMCLGNPELLNMYTAYQDGSERSTCFGTESIRPNRQGSNFKIHRPSEKLHRSIPKRTWCPKWMQVRMHGLPYLWT